MTNEDSRRRLTSFVIAHSTFFISAAAPAPRLHKVLRLKIIPEQRGAMNVTVLHQLGKEDDPATRNVVVDQVAEALKEGGHHVSLLGTHGDVAKVRTGLLRRKPDLVFNLADSFGDTDLGAVGLVGYLDLLGVAYTGGGPGEFYI